MGERHAEAPRDPSGDVHFDGILVEQCFKVKGRGDHVKLTLRCARPLRFRAVPVKLDTIAVRIAEIERLADAMIGSAFERNVGKNQATKGVGQFSAGGIDNGDVIEAGGAERGRGAMTALPGVETDVVVVTASGKKSGAVANTLRDLKAEDVTIEGERAIQVGDL